MLALRDSGLKGCHAALGNELASGLGIGSVRWPDLWKQQWLDFLVGGIDGQGLAEVVEVAVKVHIFLGDPSQV